MKQDLDRVLEQHGLDGLLIVGPAQHNPAMYYFTGPAHLSQAVLVKPRGEAPVLFCNPMERDEAARTGLTTRSLADFDFRAYLKEAEGDHQRAAALRYRDLLRSLGLDSGTLGLAGRVELGPAYTTFAHLADLLPDLRLTSGQDALADARRTKSPDEVERIRRMGQITTTVVGRVADFLTGQRVQGDLLVDAEGRPITIGEVKRRINLWLAELGAENPHGTIFAQGYDAGVPHSSGNPDAPLRLGVPIVFDIFPCEAGGGYFYDFTRTWCLGYASDEALALYETVHRVYQEVLAALEPGAPFKRYQELTCERFEAAGHPTIRQDPKTTSGYVHSIGHGLGLEVHEPPWSGNTASERDILAPGTVVTIEPGLYYPEKEFGCRLEDTVLITETGWEILAEYPLDFVLPLRG